MNKYIAIGDIGPILSGETIKPTITLWNRLESRPRTDDFNRALKAEIRDPLWMLTKQWQMGEFNGDDAGSLQTHGQEAGWPSSDEDPRECRPAKDH